MHSCMYLYFGKELQVKGIHNGELDKMKVLQTRDSDIHISIYHWCVI